MNKTTTPFAWDFGEPVVQAVKFGSRGLRGSDLDEFVKRAGHAFVQYLHQHPPQLGERPVHLIALGTDEGFGMNRNGDGFPRLSCKQHHDTFVKHARWFRDHKNRNKAISYGLIKDSLFHRPMDRVELLIYLNGTKEAADRNGGLLADTELGLLDAGKDIPVSMSCRISRDFCSSCNNAARSRAEYCLGDDEGGRCKHGGLRNRMGRVCEDGHELRALNHDPTWYDISHVPKGADRTAFVLGPLDKAAAVRTVGGAEAFELLGLEPPLWLPTDGLFGRSKTARLYEALGELAAAEQALGADPDWQADEDNRSLDARLYEPCPDLHKLGSNRDARAGLLAACTNACALLSLDDFTRLLAGASYEKLAHLVPQAAAALPDAATRLLDEPALSSLLAACDYLPDGQQSGEAARLVALKHAVANGLEAGQRRKRVVRSALRGMERPQARKCAAAGAVSPLAERLANEYMLYQAGYLAAWPANHVADLLARRNRLD